MLYLHHWPRVSVDDRMAVSSVAVCDLDCHHGNGIYCPYLYPNLSPDFCLSPDPYYYFSFDYNFFQPPGPYFCHPPDPYF